MMRNRLVSTLVALTLLTPVTTVYAKDFSMSFAWGNLKRCTSGHPNRVQNPKFKLSGVPKGTVKLKFKMVDRNVRSYNHGGGTVKYSGKNTIAPGAFKYKSPCPPNGRHTYEWTATAYGKSGKKLGKAKAARQYP